MSKSIYGIENSLLSPSAALPITMQERGSIVPDYALLKRVMKANGLFIPSKTFYLRQFIIPAVLIVICVWVLSISSTIWVAVGVALVLAFASTRIGLLGHDLGHRQIFASISMNNNVMLALIPFLGVSRSWWLRTHNAHHTFPNDLKLDPHSDIPVLAFSKAQLAQRGRLTKRVIKFQAYYFLPLLIIEGIVPKVNSWLDLLKGRAARPFVEGVGLVLHVVLLCSWVAISMSWQEAMVFLLTYHGVLGLYWGLIFAPNHKGMDQFDSWTRPDFLRSQVLSTRNVAPGLIVDVLFGGLNYQIEHHLFPNMPRNQLKKARPLVQTFCQEKEISYSEASVIKSYVLVLRHLKNVTTRDPDNKDSSVKSKG